MVHFILGFIGCAVIALILFLWFLYHLGKSFMR